METVGSPLKRSKQATPSPVATAVAAVLTTEPALIANIIQFLLVSSEAQAQIDQDDDEDDEGDEEDEDNVGEAGNEGEEDDEDDEEEEEDDDEMVEWREWREHRSIPTPSELALETIAALCRGIPELSKLVGPTNQGFWRDMVLAHFDFSMNSIAEPFNVESMLVESLTKWDAMNAYYRPSQYGFLTEIQRDRSKLATLWPEHEDPFTLFCDLTVLQRVNGPWVCGFKTNTDGDVDLTPCLLSRLDREITEQGFEILEHCGYHPDHWSNEEMHRPVVSPRWTGFERPPPSFPDGWGRYEMDMDEYSTREERRNFPRARDGADFLVFRQLVYESFTDFRRLFASPEEIPSPDFFIGKSKRSGRWLGFVGESYF